MSKKTDSLVGYARVSTAGQVREGYSLEGQREQLLALGCVRVFEDAGVSGAKKSRPGLDDALSYLRPGDTLVVCSLSRLGRSMRDLMELTAELESRGVGLKTLSEGIDTNSASGRLMLNIFASLAEFERELVLERTSLGRERARALGKTGGRPAKYTERDALTLLSHRKAGLGVRETARVMGMSTSAYYRLAKHPAIAERVKNL